MYSSCCLQTSSPLPAITQDTLYHTSVDLHDLIFFTRNVTVSENKSGLLMYTGVQTDLVQSRAEHTYFLGHIVQELYFQTHSCAQDISGMHVGHYFGMELLLVLILRSMLK